MKNQLVMLGGDNWTTWIVYNELVARHGQFPIILESNVSRWKLMKTRAKKIGLLRVISQAAFVTLIRPFLLWRDGRRLTFILRKNGLEIARPVSDAIYEVNSVNDDECLQLIAKLRPDVVVVNGTRILSRKTLAAINATVINTHQGITPQYRGGSGAYWALVNKDPENCGVTSHLVDEGIDTGNIVSQVKITPEPEDSFVTYPLLQTAAALEIIDKAITDSQSKILVTRPISGPSKVWYHPGFFEYIANAWRGVH